MSKRPAAPVVDQKKVVVIEYDKLEGTYLELGFWDDDIGAEKYAELLHKGRIREEAIEDFDGNLLRIHGQPNTAIALKNETIFRCLCTPDLQNCRACFMRKRTICAEGRAQLARLERRSAKAAARHYKAKAGVLEADVAGLTSSLRERDTEVATLKSSLAERDAELEASKAQVLALKDFIANRFTGAVQSLGAAHPVAEFQQAADAFEKESGNVGLSARAGAFGLPAERAPTSDAGVVGGGVLSGSPGSDGDITDSDDEDVHDGLARKRRRISSAGPSRPPTSTTSNNSRHRPSSSLGARRKHSVPSSSLPALAVPASSGPEQPPIRRRKLPATAASAHAVSASSVPVPEAQKPAGRSSWNSRSAQLDFDDAVVPMASIAAAVAEENAVLAASGSGKRRADSTLADNEVGLEDSQELKSASPAADTDNDSDADVDTDSDNDTISGSGSGSDSDGAAAAAAPAPAPAPAPAARRTTSWSEHEKNCLIAVMFAHADAVKAGRHPAVYDTALWAVVRRRLMAEYGIDRVPQACRMMWNRGLRELTGLDERLRRDPNRMATSLQKKAGQ